MTGGNSYRRSKKPQRSWWSAKLSLRLHHRKYGMHSQPKISNDSLSRETAGEIFRILQKPPSEAYPLLPTNQIVAMPASGHDVDRLIHVGFKLSAQTIDVGAHTLIVAVSLVA